MTKSKFSMLLMHGHNKIALPLRAGDAILDQKKNNGMTMVITA
jgi:hypothetical protein